MKTARLRRKTWAGLAVATAAAMTLGTTAVASADDLRPATPLAPATPDAKKTLGDGKRPLERMASDRASYFVQFSGAGAADLAANGRAVVRDRRADVARQAGDVLGAARRADAKARQIFVVSNAVPGMGINATPAAIREIAGRPGVVKVSRITPQTVDNSNAAALVQALQSWRYPGGTGKGVKVGVIDTGLDYTHADFGGTGTPEAYDAAAAAATDPGWLTSLPALAQTKVKGGYDFVGDAYNADPDSPTYSPVPAPDANPLDCNEHGTHVAGTATGLGVNDDGSTFTGSYKTLTGAQLKGMRIGPGMAPGADLYALKVFGCEGSTDAVIAALDWALDPNGDGSFGDRLDVINLSLGSSYGMVDDPQNLVVNRLAKHGVLSVMSAGNSGDLTDVGGSPGNAVSSLQVASSVDSFQLRDGLTVNAPAGVAGTAAGQFSIAYDWPGNGPTGNPVTGDVVAIPGANADGCDPFSPAESTAVTGKIVWLTWDDNDATRRCGSVGRSGYARDAGAIGAIFTSDLDVFGAGITGDTDIPVIQLPKTWVAQLQPSVDAGTLNVTFDGALQAQIKDYNASLTDTVSTFSSRGSHGSIGVVKPDVTAPGDTIASAGMGTGTNPLAFSGTSMASPNVAGVAALVKGRHRGWSPLMLKAAVMNTAGHDLFTLPDRKGFRYAPARVGAGRVDALKATTTKLLAYVSQPNNGVSASFGVIEAPITQRTLTRTRTLTVANTSGSRQTVRLAYEGINKPPGAKVTVSPSTLTIKPRKKATATIRLTITTNALRHRIDKTMESEQLGMARQFVSDASGRVLVKQQGKAALRVPVYAAAKPVSMTASRAVGTNVVTKGKGISQTGAGGYVSIMSVMQLGETSPRLPVCASGELPAGCTSNQTETATDIKAVGAGANADAFWFGMATYGDWANIGNGIIPFVDYDVTGDGVPDLETYVQNNPDTDLLIAWTVDYNTGEVLEYEPVNLFTPDAYDTNVFDTNVVIMPALKQYFLPNVLPALGDITYTTGIYNAYYGVVSDETGPVEFNIDTPQVSVPSFAYEDTGNTTIPVTVRPGAEDGEALVFHLHGAKGSRMQILEFPVPPAP